jgi:hypothetical protein
MKFDEARGYHRLSKKKRRIANERDQQPHYYTYCKTYP